MIELGQVKILDSIEDGYIDWGIKAINAPKVWEYTKGEGVKVVVIDTGIDMKHKEFEGKIKRTLNAFDKTTRDITDSSGHGCIHPEDEIFTSSMGLTPIIDFFNNTNTCKIFIDGECVIKDVRDDNIYTLATDSYGRSHRSKIEFIHKLRYNGKVYKVETHRDTLTLTPWHPVYVKDNRNKIKKIRADELTSNDMILLPSDVDDINSIIKIDKLPKWICDYCGNIASKGNRRQCKSCNKTNWHNGSIIDVIPIDEDLAYFSGLVFTDGHLSKNEWRVDFTSNDDSLISEFCRLSELLFNYTPKIDSDSRNSSIKRCIIYSKEIFNILEKIGIDIGDKSKSIGFPKEIQRSPLNVIHSFLSGVIDGDGSITDGRIRISSGSKKFAKECVLFLRTIGFNSSYSINPKSKTGFENGEISYNIRISNNKDIISKLKSSRFRDKIKDLKPSRIKRGTRIKNIKIENYNGYMYDLTVENYHNYIANGMIVSNTHVAGLIAGERTGVAPKSELYISNVLDPKGRGTVTSVLDGITYAINIKADILCMSLGVPRELPQIMVSRIKKAFNEGVAIVCATGNNGVQGVDYPSRLEHVIGVGGVNKDLNRASFSNYGFDMDIVAPAVDILSTFKDGKYGIMSGTSMASPLVAGGLALVKSYYRNKGIELSPKDIMDMLHKGARDRYVGHGLFDVAKMIGLED